MERGDNPLYRSPVPIIVSDWPVVMNSIILKKLPQKRYFKYPVVPRMILKQKRNRNDAF